MRGSLTLFASALRVARRFTISWAIAIAAIVAATLAFWPAFRGASGISQAIDNLPAAVVDAFGLQGFGTPAGFLRGNLYELLLPLLFSIAAVALVNSETAGDESAGRLELLLSQPVSRMSLFGARAAAALVVVAAIVLVTVGAQLAMDAVVGLSIDLSFVLATALLCGLLAALHGGVAYIVACLRPQPSLVLGAGIGVTILGYLVAALFPIADPLRPWTKISPWDWALGGNPLEAPSEPWRFLVLAGGTIVLVLLGTVLVSRRDVAAA
jgi:ABC-2 type transport system permease protein